MVFDNSLVKISYSIFEQVKKGKLHEIVIMVTKDKHVHCVDFLSFSDRLSIFLNWKCLDPVHQAAIVHLYWGTLKKSWTTGQLKRNTGNGCKFMEEFLTHHFNFQTDFFQHHDKILNELRNGFSSP